MTCTPLHNWFGDGALANTPRPLPCTSLTSTFGARCFVSPSMSCSCSFFVPSRKMYVLTVRKAIQTWLLATLTSSVIDRVSLVFSSEVVLLPVGYVTWWADVVIRAKLILSLPAYIYQMVSLLGAPYIKRIVSLFCQTFKDRVHLWKKCSKWPVNCKVYSETTALWQHGPGVLERA